MKVEEDAYSVKKITIKIRKEIGLKWIDMSPSNLSLDFFFIYIFFGQDLAF